MIALFCWFDFGCWADVIKNAINVVVEKIMEIIFSPVIDAIAAAGCPRRSRTSPSW